MQTINTETEPLRSSRDERIDFLRFVGLSLIILAHINPPSWLFQLRNFDVPLMVLVSGLSLAHSNQTQMNSSYIIKRIKRLLFPVWLFLAFYFLFIFVTGIRPDQFNIKTIASSFLLLNGIGFVWIIRVFLVISLIAPLLNKINLKIKSNHKYLGLLLSVYLLYEAIISVSKTVPLGKGYSYFSMYFIESIPYGILFSIGLRLRKLEANQSVLILLLTLATFIGLASLYYFQHDNKFIPTQIYKYPPQAYYLSYGLLLSLILYFTGNQLINFSIVKVTKGIWSFLAKNSIWVYLWHILVILLTPKYFTDSFIANYLFVYVTATLLAFVQVSVLNNIVLPKVGGEKNRKLLSTLFTG